MGYAMCLPAADISAVAGARTGDQGLASGLFTTSFQIGGGVVLGVVASVLAAAPAGRGAHRAGITAAVVAAMRALVLCLAGLRRQRELPASGGGPEADRARPLETGAALG